MSVCNGVRRDRFKYYVVQFLEGPFKDGVYIVPYSWFWSSSNINKNCNAYVFYPLENPSVTRKRVQSKKYSLKEVKCEMYPVFVIDSSNKYEEAFKIIEMRINANDQGKPATVSTYHQSQEQPTNQGGDLHKKFKKSTLLKEPFHNNTVSVSNGHESKVQDQNSSASKRDVQSNVTENPKEMDEISKRRLAMQELANMIASNLRNYASDVSNKFDEFIQFKNDFESMRIEETQSTRKTDTDVSQACRPNYHDTEPKPATSSLTPSDYDKQSAKSQEHEANHYAMQLLNDFVSNPHMYKVYRESMTNLAEKMDQDD